MDPNLVAAGGQLLDFGLGQLSSAIQFKRQRRMLDHINRYNHPRAQMQRLEEAGINPHAAYASPSAGGMSGSLPSVGKPTQTASYMDYRIKSAQTDLVQKNSDIATQKREQEKIRTEMMQSVHDYMKEQPMSIVESINPETGEVTFTETPGQLDNYQLGARAKHQMLLNDAVIKEIDKITSEQTTLEQAITRLGISKQDLQRKYDLNRLWKSIDGMVNNSANPTETLAVIIKMLLATAGAKTN